MLLVSATIVVYQQIQHVKNRDAGYNASNLIMVPATPMANQNYEVIKQELLKTGTVSSVTRTFSPITDIWWSSPAPKWPGKPAGTEIIFSGMYTDVDFSKTMGVKILEGRDFNGMPADTASMLLNRSAVEAMGLKQPLGIKLTYGPRDYTVIGITDNIIMTSPYNAVNPMMTYYNPAASNWITIRLNKNAQPKQALKAFDGIFKKHSPDDLFEYQFVDEEFGRKFATEELISRISNIFAGLAIFICCLGRVHV
ncbi:MAG: hypothetical protein EOP54_31565 [Sphingobacteriales bacterium]|nr:MAG: hypothetical protein EOP54_31565 [Sphingobacteriales bacterium]